MTARPSRPLSLIPIAVAAAAVALTGVAPSLAAPPAMASPPHLQVNAETLGLYRQLLELNGVAASTRQAVLDTRRSALEALIADKGRPLTEAEQGQFDAVARTAFDPLPDPILTMIATQQAATFTTAEIRRLVAAESIPATAAYVASAKTFPPDYGDRVQAHLVDAVVEIIRAFRDSTTIDDLPAYASDGSPLENRIAKAHRLMAQDGAEEGLRRSVALSYMPMVVAEVSKHISLVTLNDADRGRMTRLVSQAATRLGSRILRLDARRHAAALTDEQLSALIAARNTDTQRKLARIQLDQSADLDERTGQMLRAAVNQIAQAFGVAP